MKDNRVLLVVELQGESLHPATAHGVTAALQCAASCTLLVIGAAQESALQQAASLQGVELVEHQPVALACMTAENLAPLIRDRFVALQASHLFMLETRWGKDLLPRVAALLGRQPLTGVVAIQDARSFVRPTHAGNALVTLHSSAGAILATLRLTAFSPAPTGAQPCPIVTAAECAPSHPTRLLERRHREDARPDLCQAEIVVCGGQALERAGNFALIEALADALGGAVAATRSAVDAGLADNALQVGQTGQVVAPKLYIAVGLSGAIQHLAGMKDSGCIVSINSDPGAPIHAVADYRLVADLYQALPAWLTLLAMQKGKV
ncbi:electron transfer flavoprotein, alpha subunit [Magnetococcus marinus MC-1]|uniref:Electron transfer flavoprotein subunit alpha n=1 Tax=Magnetococcus marinus (strain ATCC BAA-1437 / JCM 17883 / MC-1) TaxID=156889 RepID=A0L504_MAGMM|nr:FAD-binding protein [Magnetococcus marinus]ABK43047.1 electron transfer flavoprotein, alpha subunit [Magnetococcus marinus MC-1]